MRRVGSHLQALPSHLRRRLADALETGQLPDQPSLTALRSELGPDHAGEGIIADLDALARVGISGPAVGAWLHTLDQALSGSLPPDLVWSGPELLGLPARDTRRVYNELIDSARHSVWISTFVYFDGPEAFARLAQRMDQHPDLRVTLLLNIQRSWGDTSAPDQLVRRFTDRFWGTDWPGSSRPAVYYDPRSLDPSGKTGVLHAKAVVVDEEAAFITSANLTAAAFDRNIELGVLLRRPSLALAVVRHFQGLIDSRSLEALPIS